VTSKRFYDWQTGGGTDDVMRLVACLEGADISWCAIGGIAVNHWANEPVVTRDVDIVVATEAVERALELLQKEGFTASKFAWSVNFQGNSKVASNSAPRTFIENFPRDRFPRTCMEFCFGWPHLKTRLPEKSWLGMPRSAAKASG